MYALNIPLSFDIAASSVREKFSSMLSDFIDKNIDNMIDDGSMCLDMCEELGDYHMTSYWPQGIYGECQDFL